jgi:uncharacterized protein YqeY
MKLQEKINADLRTAMLQKNEKVKSLLRVVIGEMNREGKELTDDRILSIIKKMIENLKQVNNETSVGEIQILDQYLPKQLSEKEIVAAINSIITTNSYTLKDMGKIMNEMKEKFPNQYDGKLASSIVKNLFTLV